MIADSPPTGQIGSYLRAPVSIAELVASGRIRNQSAWMSEALANPATTQLAIVTIAEELPVTETKETLTSLKQQNIVPPPLVIANRVLPQLVDATKPTGIVGEMTSLHRSIWEDQQDWLGELPHGLTISYMFGLFTPGEVAAHMSDAIEALI